MRNVVVIAVLAVCVCKVYSEVQPADGENPTGILLENELIDTKALGKNKPRSNGGSLRTSYVVSNKNKYRKKKPVRPDNKMSSASEAKRRSESSNEYQGRSDEYQGSSDEYQRSSEEYQQSSNGYQKGSDKYQKSSQSYDEDSKHYREKYRSENYDNKKSKNYKRNSRGSERYQKSSYKDSSRNYNKNSYFTRSESYSFENTNNNYNYPPQGTVPPPPHNALLYDPYFQTCCVDIKTEMQAVNASFASISNDIDTNLARISANQDTIKSIFNAHEQLAEQIAMNLNTEDFVLTLWQAQGTLINNFINLITQIAYQFGVGAV